MTSAAVGDKIEIRDEPEMKMRNQSEMKNGQKWEKIRMLSGIIVNIRAAACTSEK